MATVTTLNADDTGSVSRGVINTNFTNLNTDKAELDSPAFTGNPTAPTQSPGDNSTKIATTAYVAGIITVEKTTGVTHSLTTTASQKVIVAAKGVLIATNTVCTVTLKYGGVTKDTVTVGGTGAGASLNSAFALMYTETPGASTQNITVETSAGSLSNVVIIVQKI